MSERRREERMDGAGLPAVLRPGAPVVLLNVSAGGALVDSVTPLRPGARVRMQIDADSEPVTVGARVLRCQVTTICVSGVGYTGALQFDAPCAAVRDWRGRAAA